MQLGLGATGRCGMGQSKHGSCASNAADVPAFNFDWGHSMQRSDRERTIAVHAPVVVSRSAARSGDEFLDAKVTILGEYRSRRDGDEHHGPHPDARRHEVCAAAIGRDRRTATLEPQRNLLLAALTAEDTARLRSHLELVSLPLGTVICEARTRSDWAYFPTDGIVSLLYELENGASVEVAVTGNEGMIGTAIFMGGGATTSRAVVRNGGQGYRIPARVLKNEFENSATLRQLLLRYAQALTTQMAQTAVCHRRHKLEQQFCRMLLVSMDRLASAEVDLTQDTIAGLLGVRRESVTTAAGKLQAAGLIRCRRGWIKVLNRQLLEAHVCECYAAAKFELDRLILRPARSAHTPGPAGPWYPAGAAASSPRGLVGWSRSGHGRMRAAAGSD